jgi:hypothetical protein
MSYFFTNFATQTVYFCPQEITSSRRHLLRVWLQINKDITLFINCSFSRLQNGMIACHNSINVVITSLHTYIPEQVASRRAAFGPISATFTASKVHRAIVANCPIFCPSQAKGLLCVVVKLYSQ